MLPGAGVYLCAELIRASSRGETDQGEVEGSVRQVRARKKADVDIFGTPVYRFAQGTGVQCLLLHNLCFHGEKRDQISRDRGGRVDRDHEE